jgi:hypothetical protein
LFFGILGVSKFQPQRSWLLVYCTRHKRPPTDLLTP